MSVGRGVAVAMVVASTACLRSPVIAVEDAAGVELVAIVAVDGDGAVVAATPIVAWRAGAALPVVAAGDDATFVVGWRASDLAAIGAPLEALTGALVPATGCALPIPTPLWTARWTSSGTFERVASSAVPPLTAPWMRRACGAFAGSRVRVDVPCSGRRCAQPELAEGACDFEVDLSSCGVGVARGSVDHTGAVCFETITAPCARVDASTAFAPPPARFACDSALGCGPEVYVERVDAAPFVVDHLRIVDGPPHLPDTLRMRPTVAPWQLTQGYGLDATAVGDLVYVTFVETANLECELRPTTSTRLLGLEGDTLARVVERVLPPCAEHLVADGRGGFLATFLEGGAWTLGRFDHTGARLESVRLDLPAPGAPDSVVVDDLLVLDRPPRIALLAGATRAATTTTTVRLHDLDTLEPRARIPLALGRSFSMTDDRVGHLVVSANGSDEVAWLDVAGERIVGRVTLMNASLHAQIFRVVADPSFDAVLIPTQGDTTLLLTDPSLTVTGRLTPFSEAVAIFTSGVPWSAHPGLVLMAGGTDRGAGDRRAVVTFFDPATARFVPGVYELGFGVPSRVFEDPRGRVWALLPWAGELVRLTPR